MLKDILPYIRILNLGGKSFFTIFSLAIIGILFTVFFVSTGKIGTISSQRIGSFLIINFIIFLSLIFLIALCIYNKLGFHKILNSYFLQNRIILAFCLVSAVPTIIVASFSTYIFNYALQPWFDKKVMSILDASTSVAEAYIIDQVVQLKSSALSMSNDFGDMYYELAHNPRLLVEVLNGQAELRSLDEAIVFESNTNTILAQTALSFSLSFATIPKYLLEMADQGKAVQIPSEPVKIRVLVKLPEYQNTYLLIGRLINSKIIEHVDKNKGAATEYYNLKKDIIWLQIKFSIIFIIISLLLLAIAIIWGVMIARQIVKPIKELVFATEQVKSGDLTVQVDEQNLMDDEVMVLIKGFNRMIMQIHRQQRDLVIAQRALAWSDVARRVAHEIKNPLTPIQLASERLLKRFAKQVDDTESFERYIKIILSHSQEIEKIVGEFVNFARLPLPKFGRFELIDLINEIIKSRRLINEKIIYNITSNKARINFIGDFDQISRVMLNLLKNAEEALDVDSLKAKVELNIVEKNQEVCISIKDNGPGFQEYLISKASEAYVTSRSKGMGLGLAIVKKIVEDHLGRIEISNNPIPAKGALIKLIFSINELEDKLKQHQ